MSDLIDRKAVLDKFNAMCEVCGEGEKYNGVMCRASALDDAIAFVEDMPSAEPERKTGKWLYKPNEYDDDTYECSQCGEPWTLIDGTPEENNMKFCPNCGADMRGE